LEINGPDRVIKLVVNRLALGVDQLQLQPVATGFKPLQVDRLPLIKDKALAVNGATHPPVRQGIVAIGLGREVEGGIGEVKVQHDWLCPVGALGATVGEQGRTGIDLPLGGLGEDMEGALVEGALVLKAFMPGAGGKHPQGVGAGG
jgi:hypothetical protein